MKATKSIWMNGKLVPWENANVHILSHALHYGSSVFEGARLYSTDKGPRFLRMRDHIERMFMSARIYRMDIPYTREELFQACSDVIRDNALEGGAYLRPIAMRGYDSLGVAPRPGAPIDVAVAGIEWGAYLGADGLEKGVDVCVSSWQRVAPNTIPAAAKAAGNYLSGQLVTMEAQRQGFAEGIALAVDGSVSEGAGENLFIVADGKLMTPPTSASILAGITRATVISLAGQLGIEVIQQSIPREMLYCADELFFTGTAVEVTPIRSVDRIEVGCGSRGPITERLQSAFFGLFDDTTQDREGWLEPLEAAQDDSLAVSC